MNYDELQPGIKIIVTDDGFECLNKNDIRTVFKDTHGKFYVTCGAGTHYLDGQLNEERKVLGFGLYRGIGAASRINE